MRRNQAGYGREEQLEVADELAAVDDALSHEAFDDTDDRFFEIANELRQG